MALKKESISHTERIDSVLNKIIYTLNARICCVTFPFQVEKIREEREDLLRPLRVRRNVKVIGGSLRTLRMRRHV